MVKKNLLKKNQKKADPKKAVLADSLKTMEGIFELVKKYQIVDFEWENAHEKFTLKTHSFMPKTDAVFSGPFFQNTGPASSYSALKEKESSVFPAAKVDRDVLIEPTRAQGAGEKNITAPLVGTFYRAVSPTAAPFVKPGQVIKPGDVLCIIEAMKLMNEIESECTGKIVSVCVENGQPVEYGEPLFIIESLSE